jgi:hypothetical protein
MRREDRFACGGIAIRQRPSAVWVVAVFIPAAGSLSHTVQRDMFDDFELSHSEPLANPNAVNQLNCSKPIEITVGLGTRFMEAGDRPASEDLSMLDCGQLEPSDAELS